MKSREEVEHLKQQWCYDPCWDIAETEGFEDYKDELAIFQKNKEFEFEERQRKHHEYLASLLCPMSFNSDHNEHCMVEKCAWWNTINERCCVRDVK